MSASPRIAWLSPYGPRSDVGAFTRVLLPHFASEEGGRFDCDLFVNAQGPTYDAAVPAMDIPKGGAMGEILSRYDAAVFNLGNNVWNHDAIADALRQVPGIAVMHDFSYHHYFAHKCFEDVRSPPAYGRLMRDYYGSVGFNMALRSGVITRDATLYAPWDGENVVEYPLMQPLANLAAALVVHSKFMEERVRQFFRGPILRLFLPSDQKVAPTEAEMERWRGETEAKDRCHFATFGHIGRPKCLEVILQAMANSAVLRARSQLTIAGHPGDREYAREIEAMVTKLGLTRQVTFEYSVTNERLLAIKNDSDVFLNLRFPNTEGASGSLIEMLNAGRPVIAYRAGCYADVPEDSALLLERSEGLEAVVTAMEDMASYPARRIAVGAAGQRFVRAQDSAKYVRLFKQFALDIQADLKRRSRFVAPVRDALSWSAKDVAADDAEWFAEMTRARRALSLLDRDADTHSPEVFLTWSMDDMIAFTSRVLLHPNAQAGMAQLLVGYAQRLGRWSFYRLISRICFYQALCQRQEIAKEDVIAYADRVTDIAFWDIALKLQPLTMVGMLYLCVLERGWGPTERDNWVKRVRTGTPPATLLLDFLASPEYRQTFPDRVMAHVEDWARREVTVTAPPRAGSVRTQMTWPADAAVRFNEDNPTTEGLLGELWHRRDAQGRWSDGRTGDLRFQLPDDASRNGATLTLRLRVAGTKVTGQRRIVAQCNRREIAAISLVNDAPVNWAIQIPPSASAKDGVSLFLIADQDFSPAASGQSPDKRSLGLMLIEGRLSIAATEAEEEHETLPDFSELDAPVTEG